MILCLKWYDDSFPIDGRVLRGMGAAAARFIAVYAQLAPDRSANHRRPQPSADHRFRTEKAKFNHEDTCPINDYACLRSPRKRLFQIRFRVSISREQAGQRPRQHHLWPARRTSPSRIQLRLSPGGAEERSTHPVRGNDNSPPRRHDDELWPWDFSLPTQAGSNLEEFGKPFLGSTFDSQPAPEKKFGQWFLGSPRFECCPLYISAAAGVDPFNFG